jgi:hypothetical protein
MDLSITEKDIFSKKGMQGSLYWHGPLPAPGVPRLLNHPTEKTELIARKIPVDLFLHDFRHNLENNKSDQDRNNPFQITECFLVDDSFMSGKAPQIFYATRLEEVGNQTRGRHADQKAQEISGKLIIQVF